MSDSEVNQPDVARESNSAGIAFALGAFVIWGLIPIFFKELSHVPALEFLGYRMVWSFIFLIFLLFFRRTVSQLFQEIFHSLRDRKLMLMLGTTALLISSNWLVYIWAIAHDQVLQASLGYFINPLMNVALGLLLLGEKLSRTKLIAVGLAATGVLYMIAMGGGFPWIALYLAASFALYGLIRKKAHVGAIMGLWVEMLLLLPVALGYLLYLRLTAPPGGNGHDDYTLFMLIISGAVTTIPLVFFAAAAKRLPLSTIGVLQYIAPTMTLLFAVFLWHEPFTLTHMIAFAFIWTGLALYTMDSFFSLRKNGNHPGRES